MNFSTTDAQLLLAAMTGLTALLVAWLRAVTLPDWVKFAICAVFSGIGGALMAYVAGQLRFDASIIQNAAIVYTFGRAFYYAAFNLLGLERALLPRSALASQAREQVTEKVAWIDTASAKDAIDPSTPNTLKVEATITKN